MEEHTNKKRPRKLTRALEIDLLYFMINKQMLVDPLDNNIQKSLKYLSQKHDVCLKSIYNFINVIKNSIPFMNVLMSTQFNCVCRQEQLSIGINTLDDESITTLSDIVVCESSNNALLSSHTSFNDIDNVDNMSDELLFTPNTTAQLMYDLQSIDNPPSPPSPPSPINFNNLDSDHSQDKWNNQFMNELDLVLVNQVDQLDQLEPVQDQVVVAVVIQPSTITSQVNLKKRVISHDFDSLRKLKKRRFLWRPLTNPGSYYYF
jgi:hypothetical protein